MSNKKSGAGFYVTIALIVIVLAAIIFIVVSGSMPEAPNVPDDQGEIETPADSDTNDDSSNESGVVVDDPAVNEENAEDKTVTPVEDNTQEDNEISDDEIEE